MSRKTHSGSRIRKAVVTAAAAATLAGAGVVAGQATANAAPLLYCGPGQYDHEITVSKWGDGQFQIHVTPTLGARFAPDPRAAVDTLWRAVQACVPGLYGNLADTIYQQLDCHQRLALLPGWKEGGIFQTGPTYDLESWRPKLVGPDIFGQERDSHCLNHLSALPSGGDPDGPFGDPIRPDQGQVDLLDAYGNIA